MAVDNTKERARMALEDAIDVALDAGMTAQEIRDEVEYLLENR